MKQGGFVVGREQGGFVVLDAESYDERADEAMGKNFVPIDPVKLKEAKQDIVSLLAKENLDSLFGKVKGTKNGCLPVFYAARDHKPGIPFRAIVSESGRHKCRTIWPSTLHELR